MMPTVLFLSRFRAACLTALLLVGCAENESPQVLVNSASQYLAKGDAKAAIVQLKSALQKDASNAEARFMLGRALFESEDFLSAEKELRKAAELGYAKDKVSNVLAPVLVRKGAYKEVVDDYAQSDEFKGQASAPLKVAVGQAALAMRDFGLADRAFAAAQAADPAYSPALLGSAVLKAADGDIKQAMELTGRAVEIPYKREESWKLRGDLLLAQGRINDAVEAYRNAIQARSNFLPAYSVLIATLVREKRVDEAEKELADMKATAASNPQTLYSQALVLMARKDYKGARDAVQEELKTAPDDSAGLLLSAAINYELSAYGEAESQLLQVMRAMPGADAPRRLLVGTYLRTGQASRAMEVLQPLLPRIDREPAMLNVAAEVYLQNGDASTAAKYFEKAAALDANDYRPKTGLALTHLAQGDRERAMKELEAAASMDQGSAPDRALIASALQRGEFDRALVAIDSLEKKQPNSAFVQNLRGLALLGKKDAAAARKSFERALSMDPTFFPATLNLARLDVSEGNASEGAKRLEDFVAKNPNNSQALLVLAEARMQRNAPRDQVLDLFTRAINAAPSDVAPRLSLISYYIAVRDPKRALTAAQEAAAALPNRPEILEALARAQQLTGDSNQAIATYQRMPQVAPKSPMPFVHIADVQTGTRDYEAAIQNLRRALALQADFLPAQRGLIAVYLRQDREPQAIAVAREVQKQRPKEAAGYSLEGDVHANRKEWKEAIAAYRAGLTRTGGNDIPIKLYSVLTASGQAAEADRMASTWLKDHPEDVTLPTYLAETAQRRGDYAAAKRYYESLVALQPNNAILLNNLAYTAGKIGDERAVEYAEKANRLAPNQPPIMDTLGSLLVQKGDAKRGVDLLRKASEMAPQAPGIRFNLAQGLIKIGQKDEARKELAELAKLGDQFPAHDDVAKLLKTL